MRSALDQDDIKKNIKLDREKNLKTKHKILFLYLSLNIEMK